jgi:hypothetical protein
LSESCKHRRLSNANALRSGTEELTCGWRSRHCHQAEATAERIGQSTYRGRRHQQWDKDEIGTCVEICEAALGRERDTLFVIVAKAQEEHIRPRVDRQRNTLPLGLSPRRSEPLSLQLAVKE